MDSIYDILLQVPLFQGLSLEHFTEILEKVRFDFRKATPGEVLVYQGDVCGELLYAIKGDMSVRSEKPFGESCQVIECMQAPELIEPYSLMGYQQSYTATYRAVSEVNYVIIEKSFVLSCLCEYEIFRMNYLNILSRRVQLLQEKLQVPVGNTTSEKVYNWMCRICERESGNKMFQMRMEDLAVLVDDTRLNISRVLNAWQGRGLLRISRLRIEVFDLAALGKANDDNIV